MFKIRARYLTSLVIGGCNSETDSHLVLEDGYILRVADLVEDESHYTSAALGGRSRSLTSHWSVGKQLARKLDYGVFGLRSLTDQDGHLKSHTALIVNDTLKAIATLTNKPNCRSRLRRCGYNPEESMIQQGHRWFMQIRKFNSHNTWIDLLAANSLTQSCEKYKLEKLSEIEST